MDSKERKGDVKEHCGCSYAGVRDSKRNVKGALDCLLHKVMDIEDCIKQSVPVIKFKYNSTLKKNVEVAKNYDPDFMQKKFVEVKSAVALKELQAAVTSIRRLSKSRPVETVSRGLYIYLFAAYDKFFGDLLIALYQNKPELYAALKRDVSFDEAMKFQTIDELKEYVLQKDVETLRRDSYIEQFSKCEKRFNVTLMKFDEWSNFVECSQRRNLFTHCDGIVSKQYLDVCKKVSFKHKENLNVGDQLEIDQDYFFDSCRLVSIVSIMLAHTLWRKCTPNEICSSDEHLCALTFDLLIQERWQSALRLSNFILSLPNISQDSWRRIAIINNCIARKYLDFNDISDVLDKEDWSSVNTDFQLAYAVLTEDYSRAKDLMVRLGSSGEYFNEFSYHQWPIFKEFRKSQNFLDGYNEVYGYSFESKVNTVPEGECRADGSDRLEEVLREMDSEEQESNV